MALHITIGLDTLSSGEMDFPLIMFSRIVLLYSGNSWTAFHPEEKNLLLVANLGSVFLFTQTSIYMCINVALV